MRRKRHENIADAANATFIKVLLAARYTHTHTHPVWKYRETHVARKSRDILKNYTVVI